jgi:hypothetical protein
LRCDGVGLLLGSGALGGGHGDIVSAWSPFELTQADLGTHQSGFGLGNLGLDDYAIKFCDQLPGLHILPDFGVEAGDPSRNLCTD